MKRLRKICLAFFSGLWISGLLLVSNQVIANSSFNATNKILHNALIKQGYTAIPLKKGAGGYLYIETSFGNQERYFLLLDTGSGHITLDPKIMDTFHFKMTGKTHKGGGGDGFAGLYHEVTIPALQLGSFTSFGEKAYIMNHSFSINKQFKAGMLSIAFLRAHSAIIDIKNQYLYLEPSRNSQLSNQSDNYQKKLFEAGYKSIKLERSPHNFIILNASINDAHPQRCFLDSGSLTLLSLDYIKQQGLPLTYLENGKGAGGGVMKMFKTPIHKISVGSVNWFPKNALVTNFKYIQNGAGIPIACVIGIDWMRTAHAIIDIGSNQVFIK